MRRLRRAPAARRIVSLVLVGRGQEFQARLPAACSKRVSEDGRAGRLRLLSCSLRVPVGLGARPRPLGRPAIRIARSLFDPSGKSLFSAVFRDEALRFSAVFCAESSRFSVPVSAVTVCCFCSTSAVTVCCFCSTKSNKREEEVAPFQRLPQEKSRRRGCCRGSGPRELFGAACRSVW